LLTFEDQYPEYMDTPIQPHHPHDAYFEQVFKIKPVIQELIRAFMPADQLKRLNLHTLELASESFISDETRASLADLTYTCQTQEEAPIRVCLLFEHKSGSVGRNIYTQLLRYMTGIIEEDIRQKRPNFTLTIPILFYHGEEKWSPDPLNTQYGKFPDELSGYIPNFDFVMVNLRAMSNEQLFAMRDTVLLRNVLLVFKNIKNDDFFRENFREVFIFAEQTKEDELNLLLFRYTFMYFQMVTNIKSDEIMEMAHTLPPRYESEVKTAYEQIFEKGIEKGMEKGIEKGMESIIVRAIRNNPTLGNQQIADFLGVEVELVRQLRDAMDKN
jgi:predicted transposase/invertase (TIGR01784 family)